MSYEDLDEPNTGIMKPVLVLLITLVIAYLAIFLMGCAPATLHSPASIVAPTGTDIDKASAFTDSAETALQAAVPHTDAAGKEDLGLASSAHKSVKTSLGSALKDLSGVQTELAAEQGKIASLTSRVNQLTSSWGHRLQVWVTAAFWVIVALVAIHLIAGAIAIFLPGWGIIPGIIARVVNPFGWCTWLVTVSEHAPSTAAIRAIL